MWLKDVTYLEHLRWWNTRYKTPQLIWQHEQIWCLKSFEFDEKWATKPTFVAQSRPVLYFWQQLSSTCNKCFCCMTSQSWKVKNVKHQPKTCIKTMFCDKLKVFSSRFLPLLRKEEFLFSCGWRSAGLQRWQNLSSSHAKLWSTLLKMTLAR